MPITTLAQIPMLYHFTDRRNLASIVQLGGLYPHSNLMQQAVVIAAPGGNDWSHDADAQNGVGGDVHLCFRNNHPMEHVARQDGRLENTIFLQIHPSVLTWEGVRFTNDVSNKAGVLPTPIACAEPLIDFEVLYTRTNWSDPAIKARLDRAEKCEVLVPHMIPLAWIRNI
ncbi:DarT ssDNA thymidine ADP-ribosyltransferase family protein [Rhizobium johnstonii]|uniref:DarT ssDNA thymidine ADP-ribosyltransferase family protein n=1 Tax=Rhizobium johnstonii TaxID=3019933 RepID=UPI003F9ABA40